MTMRRNNAVPLRTLRFKTYEVRYLTQGTLPPSLLYAAEVFEYCWHLHSVRLNHINHVKGQQLLTVGISFRKTGFDESLEEVNLGWLMGRVRVQIWASIRPDSGIFIAPTTSQGQVEHHIFKLRHCLKSDFDEPWTVVRHEPPSTVGAIDILNSEWLVAPGRA